MPRARNSGFRALVPTKEQLERRRKVRKLRRRKFKNEKERITIQSCI